MSVTKTNANSDLRMPRESRAAMNKITVLHSDQELTEANAPGGLLQSTLSALSDGRIVEAVAQFHERFKFNDHALALEFTDKARLAGFFEKSRELFPDTALEIISLFESGGHAIAQWKLSATQTVPYGSISYRTPISLYGTTIVRVEDGKIVEWSDCYDQASSRRIGLAGYFTEWTEY